MCRWSVCLGSAWIRAASSPPAPSGPNSPCSALNDELELRYRGGIPGRINNFSATSDTWKLDTTIKGRANVYSLLETGQGINTWDPGVYARPYLTTMSAVANYMVGDPRTVFQHQHPRRHPARQRNRGFRECRQIPGQVVERRQDHPGQCPPVRESLDNLVSSYISGNSTQQSWNADASKKKILTEIADGFRFALDGYVPSSVSNNSTMFVGKTPTGSTGSPVDPMDQMAAHLAANLISLSNPDNSPVIFTYKGMTVVGIPQIPVIQKVSEDGNTITLFNPWDTAIALEAGTLLVKQKIGGTNH